MAESAISNASQAGAIVQIRRFVRKTSGLGHRGTTTDFLDVTRRCMATSTNTRMGAKKRTASQMFAVRITNASAQTNNRGRSEAARLFAVT